MTSRVLFVMIIGLAFAEIASAARERLPLNSRRENNDDLDADNDDLTDDYGDDLIPLSGSCKEARLCCEGRDASCIVQKGRQNAIVEDVGDRACFCDSACLAVGDCCHDYKETCGVTDCLVSEWGQWSDCDVQCGLGTSTRTRRVYRHARNGGAQCPELTQKRSCHGFNCKESRSSIKVSRESALILASSYSNLRVVNETQDIRRNLRMAYPKDPQKENSHEYCVVFEVTKSRKSCEISLDDKAARALQPTSQVCVSCQSAAWRKHLGYRCHGHGVDEKQTRWSSVSGSGCHGRWVRKGMFDECPCHSDGRPDFIFV